MRDAGDLLERLHILTRADVTTRNERKASRLSGAYDDIETRIAALREQEELDSIRPGFDGNRFGPAPVKALRCTDARVLRCPAPKESMALHVVPIGWVSERRSTRMKKMSPLDLGWSWADVVAFASAEDAAAAGSPAERTSEGEDS